MSLVRKEEKLSDFDIVDFSLPLDVLSHKQCEAKAVGEWLKWQDTTIKRL
jgi:hypothetical protein